MSASSPAGEDASHRICPSCGYTVRLDEDLCPVCGLRFVSFAKQMSDAESVRRLPLALWRWRRYRWSVALIALTVVVLLVLVAGSLLPSSSAPPRATSATPTPTLPAASPTPALLPGFIYYTDNVSGFQAQYPASWQSISHNPGVEFDDSVQNPTYILQILLPTDSQDTTTDWVAYELRTLSQQVGQGHFIQLPGTVTLIAGGSLWTGSAAQITQGQTTIAVQVVVTVHEGRVYVINMLAANVSMSEAQARYFNEILDTFIFLS
jgi:hypothetical protein